MLRLSEKSLVRVDEIGYISFSEHKKPLMVEVDANTTVSSGSRSVFVVTVTMLNGEKIHIKTLPCQQMAVEYMDALERQIKGLKK